MSGILVLDLMGIIGLFITVGFPIYIAEGLALRKGRSSCLLSALMILFYPLFILVGIPLLLILPINEEGLLKTAKKRAMTQMHIRCPFCYQKPRSKDVCQECGEVLPKVQPKEPSEGLVQALINELRDTRRFLKSSTKYLVLLVVWWGLWFLGNGLFQ